MGKLLEDPSLKLYSGINHQEVKAILWNHRHPALSDVRVRRALTMAIDRRTLMGLLHLPERTPVLDAPPTLAQLQSDSFPEYWSYDVERAGGTLDEAGWRDANGDGVRERKGEDLAITLLVPGAEEETAAVFVQDQLARVGVRAEIVHRDGLAVAERWQSGDFDAAIFLITSHLHGGEQDISYLYGPESPIGYHNPAVIELLQRAVGASSPSEVLPMYAEFHPLVAADVPITPLYPVVWNWVVHERVRGLGDDRLYDPVWNMERLWIEEDGSGGPGAP
jgi:peptide/nickel transport system substrate-binding protein